MTARARSASTSAEASRSVDHRIVVLLERRDHLQDQVAGFGAAPLERVEHPVGIDPAIGVARRGERPVVVAVRVRLLELDDRRHPAELAQPGVRIAVRTARPRHAHVADVEAQPDRDPPGIAVVEQVADHRHRRRLAGGGEVLDHEVVEPGAAGRDGEVAERVAQGRPRAARRRSGSVQSGTLSAPTCPPVASPAGGRGPGDRPAVPRRGRLRGRPDRDGQSRLSE